MEPPTNVPGSEVEGFMSTTELWFLYEFAQCVTSIIEIGSWCGRSTSALAAGCKGPVYAIDHFQGSREHANIVAKVNPREKFEQVRLKYPNIHLIEMSSLEAARVYPELRADWVFIDGSHEFQDVVNDIEAWRPRARRFLMGHDIQMPAVRAALEDRNLNWYYCGSVFWLGEIK